MMRRVQDLPPELFNMVQTSVISTGPTSHYGKQFIRITRDFKFPKALQINRSSREALAPLHYSNKIFIFGSPALFRLFIFALDPNHILLPSGHRVAYQPGFGGNLPRALAEGIQRIVEHERTEKDIDVMEDRMTAKELLWAGEPFAHRRSDQIMYVVDFEEDSSGESPSG